jgi:hypothetical protein
MASGIHNHTQRLACRRPTNRVRALQRVPLIPWTLDENHPDNAQERFNGPTKD